MRLNRYLIALLGLYLVLGSTAYAETGVSIWKVCSDRGVADPRLVPTDMPTEAQMAVLRSMMAAHSHRVAHALWHLVRGSISSDDQATIAQSYGDKWNTPHQQCPLPASSVDTNYNPFGEDFLYMHRGMVGMVQAMMINAGLPCIAPWTKLPEAGDPTWPVPDYNGQDAKSNQALSIMKDWEKAFDDPQWLRIHSLAQVGFMLENTLHNNMHNRWATQSPPSGFFSGANIPFNNQFPSGWPYDNSSYDWLADPYSAAVNKHFWKLHGLVDQIVDKWLAANGYQSIAEDCHGAAGCYQWVGTWVGEPMVMATRQEVDRLPTRANFSAADAFIRGSAIGAFEAGNLTNEVLKHENEERSQRSQWSNDPEDFIRRYFCNGQ